MLKAKHLEHDCFHTKVRLSVSPPTGSYRGQQAGLELRQLCPPPSPEPGSVPKKNPRQG